MGEAKRRGSFEERKKAAIKRNKKLLIEKFGERDEHLDAVLRAGIAPFFEQLGPDEWQTRRRQIINHLNARPNHFGLENAPSIRVQQDEMGWYLFLCSQALDDPLCMDIAQAQRILPFFVGIGAYSGRIRPRFRRESGHRSDTNPATIPIRFRPPFRSNPASVI
ncbi:MAG: hypothetical protein RBR38_09850 [Desulfomicrobium apsheronum]|nr:hypothetical protein [Desulfomicrobium apsheronum]